MQEVYTINNLSGEPIDFETREYIARTLQNAKNLLCLRKGEVPFDRMSGVDTAIEHMAHGQMQEIITAEVERVLAWEPDVRVRAVRARAVDAGMVYIEADVTIEEG